MTTSIQPAPVACRPSPLSWMPGLLAVVALASVATLIGHRLPLLGAPVAGIVLGVLLAHPLRSEKLHGGALHPGVVVCSSRVLQFAVVLLGAQLSLGEMAHVGLSSLPVMLGTLALCLIAASLLGRALGIDSDLRILIGVGTAICGASAIAAVSPVIKARSASVAYAISTIFFFNIAAVLIFPPLGHLLGMSQEAFGLFAGTAVNDTSSVVAASTTYGSQAGEHAVVVKLTRSLMIIPVTLALGAMVARRSARDTDSPNQQKSRGSWLTRLVPWFLVGFVLMVTANSLGLLPHAAQPGLEQLSIFFITMALVAIGLSVDLPALGRAGTRPLLLGSVLWLVVSTTSLLLQSVTM
ncbi:MAG: YeiH family protein [Marmoricola sp.]